jgi:hypothetical protein
MLKVEEEVSDFFPLFALNGKMLTFQGKPDALTIRTDPNL